jgi:hypothetical protein
MLRGTADSLSRGTGRKDWRRLSTAALSPPPALSICNTMRIHQEHHCNERSLCGMLSENPRAGLSWATAACSCFTRPAPVHLRQAAHAWSPSAAPYRWTHTRTEVFKPEGPRNKRALPLTNRNRGAADCTSTRTHTHRQSSPTTHTHEGD